MTKKDLIIVVVFLAIGFGGGTFLFRAMKGNDKEKTEKKDDKTETKEVIELVTDWTCSFHPDVRKKKAGICPLCEVDLVPAQEGMDQEETEIVFEGDTNSVGQLR